MKSALAWLLAAALLASVPAQARKPNPDVVRLQAQLAELDADPSLAELAGLERLTARQAVAALDDAGSRQRDHALYIAERRVQAAVAAAQAESLAQQSAQLDRERDRILLEASRRDAELARREAERLRLQNLAREEEAQRLAAQAEAERQASAQAAAEAEAANAQAAQARKLADARAKETALARKEAELAAAVAADSLASDASPPPSRRVGDRTIYTLDGTAFAAGKAELTAAARARLVRLSAQLPASGTIRIEGHTDSSGSDAANLALSQQRADAVRRALAEAGVAAARMQAVGRGEADPITDNGTAEGRARNRRVEISVKN